MLAKFKKVFVVLGLTAVSFCSLAFTAPQPVAAQDGNLICRIFPFIGQIQTFGISQLCKDANVAGQTATSSVVALVKLGLQLIFVGIIVISIYVIIKAAVQYIRSEGDEDKVKQSQKAIKTVFVGIAALFIGIIGIIIVLAFFQAGGALDDPTDEVPFFQNLLN